MEKPFHKVLVAFGLDTLDDALLKHLRRLVEALEPLEIHAVTVEPSWTVPGASYDRAGRRAAWIEQEVRTVLAPGARTKVITAILQGATLDAILDYVDNVGIDVALIGHHRGAPSRALARRLARKAACAVFMVPDGAAPAVRRILVPVDFSHSSGLALTTALAICRAYGLSECMVLNVYCHLDSGRVDEDQIIRGSEEAEMERFLEGQDTGGVKVVPVFEEADDVASGVATVVSRYGIDLICIGARGRSRAAAVVLGSATEDVLSSSPCPVLVVRSPGPPLSLLDVLVRRVFTEDDRPRPV